MPLYDILNEFQKGGSHMAAVTKVRRKRKSIRSNDLNGNDKPENLHMNGEADLENGAGGLSNANESKQPEENRDDYDDLEDGEVIGIITLEDVMEELLQVRLTKIIPSLGCRILLHICTSTNQVPLLSTDFFLPILQEEIVDETDEYIDVHKK